MTPKQIERTRAFVPPTCIGALALVVFPMPLGAAFSGLVLGLLAALAAVGLALIWRANRIVNFAHGDLGTFPATLTVLLVTLGGLPWLLAVALGAVGAVLVGVVVDVVVIRRFADAPRLQLTVATIGVAQVLAFGSLLLPRLWGAGPALRSLPAPFEASFAVGEVRFDGNDLIALVVAPLLMLAVAGLLRWTDVGIAVRAAADRPDRAASLGIPVRRVEALVWTSATVLAFVSVVLTAGVVGLPFGAGVGLAVVLRALAALVLGQMTHLGVIAASAIAIGVLESGIRWNTGDTRLASPILAALIIVALLFQRRGTTRAERSDGARWDPLAEVRPLPAVLAAQPRVRIARAALWVVLGATVLLAPLAMGTNGQMKAGIVVVFAIVGSSVVVLTGWAGQVSLGQMALVGVGAAVGTWGIVEQGWEPFSAMVLAGPVGAVVAVLVGLPALRLRGLYLAVTTLALALAASEWVFSNRAVDWIPTGTFARPPFLHRVALDTPLRLYYFALGVLVVVLVGLRGLRRSRTGRVLVALRDHEPGAAAHGIDPVRAKLTAFAASGFVAAVAGVVLAVHQASFRAVTYEPHESLSVFVATVIGGLGSLVGGVTGAVFQRGAQWLLPAPWSFLATGLGVLVVLVALPDGLGGLIWRGRDRVVRWLAGNEGPR